MSGYMRVSMRVSERLGMHAQLSERLAVSVYICM